MLTRKLETKQSLFTGTDYAQVEHNTFITLDNAILSTQNGTADNMASEGQRIGDEITLKGISLKMMIEIDE